MLKLTIILVILIVLLFVGIKLASTPKSAEKGAPTTSSTQKEEDEDTSSTATSRPIDTEPPEEEDPGTCETTGDWAMSGECQADGTAIYTQTYKESKPGACPSTEKARTKPCCYQKGDWTDTTGCNSIGKKTQKQTTVNCAENMKTREVNCPYVGTWRKTGGCNADGKQYYVRDVVNSTESREKSENCCYISPWGGWGGWGGCNGSKRYRTRNRTVINCPSGTATSETGSQNCNHCQGSWRHDGYRYGGCRCVDMGRYKCNAKGRNRIENLKYAITKNATNGGNGCPHSSGATKSGSSQIVSC